MQDQTAVAAGDFDQLRASWRALLDGGPNYDPQDPDIQRRIAGPGGIDETARTNLGTLNTAPNRPYLWADLPSDTLSDQITISYERLRTMALAHNTRGSTFYNSADMRAAVIEGMDWLYANRYFIREPYGNWFPWQIGIPLALCDLVVLLYEYLSATQIAAWMAVVDSFMPSPRYTAANLIFTCQVVAERAILAQDPGKIALARDSITPLFQYVEVGDGFYRDGSFIQHERVPYTGGYGAALLGTLTRFIYLVANSPWAVNSASLANAYRWVYDSFEPVIYRGAMMDMVRGREISRETSQDHAVGQSVIGTIALLADATTGADRDALRGMVARWLRSDTYAPPLARFSVGTIARLKELLATVQPRPPLDTFRMFPQMDRAVVHRPKFAFGISMSSSRIYNFETNSFLRENKRGWYTADGMTYLYNADLGQFSGDFWPTVDARRLPGITVDSTLPREPYSGEIYLSPRTWVGGVSLLNWCGVVGMDYAAWGSSLVARKSWFVFDSVIIAAGSNISAADGRPIETIVENRKLELPRSRLSIDGVVQTNIAPWSQTTRNSRWAHLATGITGGGIGYYFFRPTALVVMREERTASWFEINETFGSQTPVTRPYLSLALNHGTNPSNAGYAYVLLPNRNLHQTAAFARNPTVAVLAHSAEVHAIKDTRRNMLGAAFWQNEPQVVAENGVPLITCRGQAAVMLWEARGQLSVAVADPTQLGTTIELTIHRPAASVIAADPGVTMVQIGEQIVLRIEVGGAKGRTFGAQLRLQ